jgi:flavin reductase (DIM6/NTAB) family NADH-FMN oxidoreductase RutF
MQVKNKKGVNMANKKIEVSHIMPCSVNLLTVASKTEREAMTATAMFVSEDPPLFVVSIQKDITTHRLIEETGQIVLNIASTEQVKLAKKLGHEKAADKFKEFGIETGKATSVSAPTIKGSFANIECKVITSFPVSKFTVYVVEAVAFNRNEDLSPIVWDMNRYYSLGKEVE